LKIDPIFYEDYLKNKFKNINIIFLYGTNSGLVDLIYEKTLEILEINTNDPFSVSKIDGDEFRNDPSILHDNINTLNVFSEKRFILLDLMHISVNKSLEAIILETVKMKNNSYLLIIKASNLKTNSFIKHFQSIVNAILVPCYEQKINIMYSKLSDLFSKHKINFKRDIIENLMLKLSSDSLTNEMEIEKLDVFLTNNRNVTEDMIFTLISNNDDLNLNQVIENCSNGKPRDALTSFENIYENQSTTINLIRMFVNHFKLIEKIFVTF